MSAVVESISHDIIASSEIEGVELNNEQVRSSVARKLGVQLPNPTESSRYIDGVVEIALTQPSISTVRLPMKDSSAGTTACFLPDGAVQRK